MEGSKVVPGERICAVGEMIPGKGTYVRANSVFSSLVGTVAVHVPEPDDDADAQKVRARYPLRLLSSHG